MAQVLELVLTCEHASARVPARWAALFRGASAELASHRAYDIGALELARELRRLTGAPLHAGRATRLVVDLNRSIGHPRIFSERTRSLPSAERERILAQHYHPYRTAVEADIERALARAPRVLHLALHSFTPVLDGVERTADIGLLYDASRALEREFADALARALIDELPELRLRRNYPYRGTSDGLTTALRKRFPADRYAGIELELNQALVLRESATWQKLRKRIATAIRVGLLA